jgi:hypothetical protein
LSRDSGKVHVQVKYGDVEQTFEGNIEETWLLLSKFFGEFIATFDVARKLALSVDAQKLARDCEGLIAFSSEGANILVAKNKLTDNETLALWLLASYLGHKLGLVGSDSVSKEDLQAKLGKSAKITSTRLGELVKMDWAAKTEDDRFRMTTFGVTQMQRDVLPRIIAKTGI